MLNNIQNLIFDLGGVIIDLDFPATYRAFARLAGRTPEQIKSITGKWDHFMDYEKGLISSSEFRQQLRGLLNTNAPDDAIDDAWCCMLGGIPVERLTLLKQLRRSYRTFALSNTNEIHVRRFNEIVSVALGNSHAFADHFDEIYFSHLMNMRKPDPEIYLSLLNSQKLDADKTLFIDDTWENIDSAQRLGIRTFHLQNPGQLITLFNGVA